MHPDVGNAGFHEDLAFGFETIASIERFCAGLGVEEQSLLFRCASDQALQHCCSDSQSSPLPENSHAPDLSARQEPGRADRFSCEACGFRVHGCCIETIPFEIGRDALLFDKDLAADGRELRGSIPPVDEADPAGSTSQSQGTPVRRDRSAWLQHLRCPAMSGVRRDPMYPAR